MPRKLAQPPALSRGSLAGQVAAAPGDSGAAAAAVTQESLPRSGRGGLRAAVDPLHTETREVELARLGERLSALRLCDAEALATLRRSLEEHGQLAALTVFAEGDALEIIDGFKRVARPRRPPCVVTLAYKTGVRPRAALTHAAASNSRSVWVGVQLGTARRRACCSLSRVIS